VLVDLAEKEDATPVLDFFGIISDETKVIFLLVPVICPFYIKLWPPAGYRN
jgi:hypothetical protein